MIKRPARIAALSILCAAGACAAGAAALAAADPPGPFTVALEVRPPDGDAPTRPALVAGEYVVEVYGAMAVGTLTFEFANESASELTAVYSYAGESASSLGRLEALSKTGIRELRTETEPSAAKPRRQTPEAKARGLIDEYLAGAKPEDPGQATAARAALLAQLQGRPRDALAATRATRPATPAKVRSEPFEIEAEDPVSLRSDFRWALPVERGRFRLTLPAIGEAARETEEPAPPTPLRIRIAVHHAQPLLLAESSTHDLVVDFVGDRTIIETVQSEVAGDRPFELEFAVDSEHEPTLAGYVHQVPDGRSAIEATLSPPEDPGGGAARPKQMLFILDSSGSMEREEKLDQARQAVLACIERLEPTDRFNIVEFDDDFTALSPAPVDPEEYDEKRVKQWLQQLRADGGTRLLPALEAAFGQPADADRHRMIVVVTDGILADEEEALALLREKLGDGRLFVVGTGSYVRQTTLLRLADFGRGAATFAGRADQLEEAVTELFDSISRPLGWDLELDWEGAVVEEILPSRLPDLYAGRPVRVLAWVRGDTPSALRLRMSTTEGERHFEVKLPPPPPGPSRPTDSR